MTGVPPAVPVVESCPARAALAGNPSDGFGGAVVSIPLASRVATVRLRPAARFEIAHSPTDDDTFATWSSLDRHVGRFGYSGARALVLATLRRFAHHTGMQPAPCAIDVDSTIPRSVGLAGSSAIVIATLRALRHHVGRPAFDSDQLASLALSVEVDELGYAAGLQDRVVQAYGRPVLMTFGDAHVRDVHGLRAGTYHPLDTPVPGTIVVAHRATEAEPSQVVHGDLRRRFDEGDRRVHAAMAALTDLALAAADAIGRGDHRLLGEAMDASFDIRRSIMDLRPGQVEMIDVARACGTHANFAGSGGAVTVLASRPELAATAAAALVEIGCGIIDVG